MQKRLFSHPSLSSIQMRPSDQRFCSVLHTLQSPQNVGTIIRAHVAFGGGPVVFIGQGRPWDFKKGSQAFSRKLERLCELVFLEHDAAFFDWSLHQGYTPVAVEIAEHASPLPGFRFPERPAIVVGNERAGLSPAFLTRCEAVVSIPQFGNVECHNVAVSCALAMYELNRCRADVLPIAGSKFALNT